MSSLILDNRPYETFRPNPLRLKPQETHFTFFNDFILKIMARSFVLLAAQPGVGVGDLDGQLSGPLHNDLPVLGRDVVSDLSTVCPRKKKKHIWI